jgi:hypothetical protein
MKPAASAMEREIKIVLFAGMIYPSLLVVNAIPIALHMHHTTWLILLFSKRRSGMLHIALMIAPWDTILIKSLSSVSLATWIVRHATDKKLDHALHVNQLSISMKVSV